LVEEWDKHERTRFQTSWEQARFIAHKILLPYAKRGGLKLTDIARFDWEPEPDIKPVQKEDINRMLKQFGDS